MTLEAQREAIARACGWRSTIESWYSPEGSGYARSVFRRRADEIIDDSHILPDYLNDLNAAHEFENTLTPKEQVSYARRLAFHNRDDASVSHWIAAHASAAERAEQFLKIKGLWVDERKPEPKISIATKPIDVQAGISLVIKDPPFPMNQNVN